jgi:Cu2+-exporting ATPase
VTALALDAAAPGAALIGAGPGVADVIAVAPDKAAAEPTCAHCGLPAAPGRRFCCPGCAAAFDTIQSLGLGSYYERCIAERPPRPERSERYDLSRFVTARADGAKELVLAVDGLRCGACVWLIESVLGREATVLTGRVNMTSRRLKLVWCGPEAEGERLVERIESLGYRLVPFDPAALAAARDDTDRALIRALAVAGFAAINVMLMSIGIWAGDASGLLDTMGPATRDLLHYVSAIIALPAIVYCGQPFFRSALAVSRHGRTNMDVPISIGVVLVSGLSLAQTMAHARDAYFDSAITLLFFLLIGRVLDHRARGRVRATVELLLTLRSTDVTVLAEDGTAARRPARALLPGERVLVGMGERIGIDGVVERGESSVDTSLVTGENLPVSVVPGGQVFAGTMNLGAPLTVVVTAPEDGTLLAECARLIEASEARRSRFVVLADRVARRYAPAVHLTALATFLGWYLWGGASFTQALLTACAVLIITCPCALALAVPAVQVIATARLFRAGILLKSATALERLAEVDTVVFDKTGTLTEPSLALVREGVDPLVLRDAASLAAHSRHPLARALVAASGNGPMAEQVEEHPGQGVSAGEMRLGSAAFVGVPAFLTSAASIGSGPAPFPKGAASMGTTTAPPARRGPARSGHLSSQGSALTVPLVEPGDDGVSGRGDDAGRGPIPHRHGPARPGHRAPRDVLADGPIEPNNSVAGPELWFSRPGHAPVRFTFAERPRFDAVETIARLRRMGLKVRLLSGDREASVAQIAAAVGIDDWCAECSPIEKVAALRQMGGRVLMVGDGLNDGPCLAEAHVSASPATAADISQTLADAVFQGAGLGAVADLIVTARRARGLMRGNIGLSLAYNSLMVPLAIAGLVTPWLAAAAMSGSSLLVIGNSFRARA